MDTRRLLAAPPVAVVSSFPLTLCLCMIQSGTKMAEKRKQVIRITTGCKALDNLLGGGIESMRSGG